MKYTNAKQILPERLLAEIQHYIQGESLYIPKQAQAYRKWGSLSGGRQALDRRNDAIRQAFRHQSSIEQLAEDYFLSVDTIKRIVYAKQK
ncbi:hypothetical protein IDH44_00500 [Paenibacillus sp. IB182496]|uniref:Mor transcription activator domain-containing protein n=1 Tax=Paenibacillus sabuli TaxID=2772509 RepID=A0A927BQJ0_9BACL|nr:CD3324 family protein [Paenibacillus sabuli]MBD2843653.1 hypothetical protein [Paenibacillus sabuli]